jgi:hypothetical protein
MCGCDRIRPSSSSTSTPKKYLSTEKALRMTSWGLFLLLASGPVLAQGRKPEKTESKHPVKTAKDGANDALDGLDQGIHKAGSAVKEGANQALDAVDKGVHKVIGSEKK